MPVSIIITTRNRADDLARTLDALARLQPPPAEILVTLDGCTDGSADLLRSRFPHVRVRENHPGQGSIPARDAMLRAAAHDLVLSLDDDSHPVETDFLARAAALFAADPALAVATFPQRTDEFPDSLHAREFGPDRRVGSYTSSGAMLRRSAYLASGGYPAFFSHAYEEPDYALQCLAAGRGVRFHAGLTIRHHYSGANRHERRTHQLHARNEQWSIWLRCPSPWWPLVSLRRLLGQAAFAARRGPGWLAREPQWWLQAARGFPRAWRGRAPVSARAYRAWLHLLRHPEPL
jgi:GT2 family glycosyltransferase